MSFQKTPGGTRGGRGAPSNALTRGMMKAMTSGGAVHNPAWYHNIAAHPDQVWIEFGGKQLRVTPTQLDGDARAQAWQRITQSQPRYHGYETKTDRAIPVIRLTRAD